MPDQGRERFLTTKACELEGNCSLDDSNTFPAMERHGGKHIIVVLTAWDKLDQLSEDLRELFRLASRPEVSILWSIQTEIMPARTVLDEDNISACLTLLKVRCGADVIQLLERPNLLE